MTTVQQHQLIEQEIARHHVGSRTKSAALLAWFLEAVHRIEPEDIETSICDGPGDKGIDGLLVNEDLGEITILQSKYRANHNARQGDVDLKNLVGAAVYCENVGAVDTLLQAGPNTELRQLLSRLKIRELVAAGAHARRLLFVTNGTLDPAGRDYLAAVADHDPPLVIWDLPRIATVAQRTQAPELLAATVILDAAATPTKVTLEGNVEMAVALVPAMQLAQLPGIDDLSLFDRNVRLSEGRTRINRELEATIRSPNEHALFPAYHNGLTVLTHDLAVKGNCLTLQGLTVVNGCQSLVTLRSELAHITDDLRLMVKVIEVDPQADLADKITYRSNNQNAVDIRDQRSRDVIQRQLQKEVESKYGALLGYEIRKGETVNAPEVIDNQTAAQFLMAIYQREPWNAVRKVRLFDHDYRRIFGHETDAHRMYFVHLVRKAVDGGRGGLRADLAGSFASVRVTLAYLLREVLELSERGKEFVQSPGRWLPERSAEVSQGLSALTQGVVDTLNAYISEQRESRPDEFDPKVVFKSRDGVRSVEHDSTRDARAIGRRVSGYLFDVEPVR